MHFVAHHMQNFLSQGGVQTPKLINTYQFRLKRGVKLSIFSSPNAKFSYKRKVACKLQKLYLDLYTYKFRLKRA